MHRVIYPFPRLLSNLPLFLLLVAAPAFWASAAEDPEGQAATKLARQLAAVSQQLDCGPVPDPQCEGRKEALDRLERIQQTFANRAPSTLAAKGFTGISGTVTAASGGAPLAGADVIAWRADGSGFGVVTNASGQYTLQVPPHTYFVTVSPESGPYRSELYDDLPCPYLDCDYTMGTPVVVLAGALTSDIDFALEPAGAISGTVRDLGTGSAIDEMLLLLYDSLATPKLFAVTDAAGDYDFGGLPAGDHFIRVFDRELYPSVLYDDIPCPGGSCDISSGDPVTATAGTTTAGIDFDLAPGDGVTGQVREASGGAPITSAEVVLRTDSGAFVSSDFVDGLGNYAVGAAPGTYYVTVNTFGNYLDEVYDDTYCPRGRYCDVTLGDPVVVTAGAVRNVVSGIDFELDPAGEISGTVTNSGAAVGTSIEAWNAAGELVGSSFSSSLDGTYSLGGLATGSYFVTTEDSGILAGELYDDLPCPSGGCDPTTGTAVLVTNPATTSGIDFDLQPGAGISGILTELGGSPISSVQVRFWNSSFSLFATTFSNVAGDYGQVLPPGSYFVSTRSFGVWADELYDDIPCPQGSCFPGPGEAVVVGSGPTTGIDFELTTSGSLAGTVRDQGTMAPLVGFTVLAYDATGRLTGSTQTAIDGTYTIDGLVAGDYFVQVRGRDLYFGELWDDSPGAAGCMVTTGTPVAVAFGASTGGIDFDLDNSKGITGRVVAEGTGTALVDVLVAVYDAAGDFVISAVTDSAGDYQVAVQPGTYYLRTSSHPEPYFDELYDDLPCGPGCVVTDGTPVVVAAGVRAVTSGIDFELVVGGEVAGMITTATILNTFFNLGTVTVWDSAGQLVSSDRAVLEGAFAVGPLNGGTYFLTLQPDNPLLEGQLFDAQPCPAATCDPTTGTAITVNLGGQTVGVDFDLAWSSSVIFIDGFEDGTTDAWTRTLPP